MQTSHGALPWCVIQCCSFVFFVFLRNVCWPEHYQALTLGKVAQQTLQLSMLNIVCVSFNESLRQAGLAVLECWNSSAALVLKDANILRP